MQRSSGLPGPCARDLTCRYAGRPRWSGQALVEFALILPVMMLMILGAVEAGFLVTAKGAQDRRTSVVAEWAAAHPGDESWHAIADRQLPGCDVSIVDHPDDPPDVITIGATCEYRPVATHGLWDGLPISSEESAVAAASPAPSPAPSAGPSGSVVP